MKKRDLIATLSGSLSLPKKEVQVIVEGILEAIKEGLKEDKKVELRRFGSWVVKKRKAAVARLIKENKPLKIPPHNMIKFYPSERLVEEIQGG